MIRLYPPQSFTSSGSIARVIAYMLHLIMVIELGEVVVVNIHVGEQRLAVTFHLYDEAGSVRNPDMRHTIIISTPTRFRNAARLAEYDIHAVNGPVSHPLKDAVANRCPRIFLRELDLYAKAIGYDVGKGMPMPCIANLDVHIHCRDFHHVERMLLKRLRVMVQRA